MKKTNKKGFTLIELLAVIVILAILITVSVPAVTKYLNGARKSTFLSNAQSAISAVRTDVISKGITSNTYYLIEKSEAGKIGINDLLEAGKGLNNSTYSKAFDDSSFILVKFDANGAASYNICLIDAGGNGIIKTTEGSVDAASNYVAETLLTEDSVISGIANTVNCDYTDVDPVPTERAD